MSVNFKALGGLLTFRFINEVEDLDLDDLQDIYNDLEEEHKKLKGEMGRLKDAIDKKNPEERKEKIKKKLTPAKDILSNEDIPYEVRMKYIIDAYRKDQKKWEKVYAYAKHLEEEVIRLKNILMANGYADSGVMEDSEPAKVIRELKEKIKELEGKGDMPKDVTAALIKIKSLENQIETFPLKVIKAHSFKSVIKSQDKYIKELQALLDENGIEYQPEEPKRQLVVEGVDKVVDEAVRYGNNFITPPMFVNSPRQSMRVNMFKSMKALWPQEKELVKIVYSMMCSQEVCLRTHLYRSYIASGNKDVADEMKLTKFAAFAPCAIFSEGKKRENVTGLTDLCYLDFYNIKEEKRLIDAMNILRNDRNVLMASRSVSNEGLRVLIPYKLKDMELLQQRDAMTPDEMEDVYANVYNYLADIYLEKLGLMPDYQAGHMERLFIVSYDSELHYNPNAEPLTIDLNEPINYDDGRLAIMSIGGKIREAERLIAKCNLYEAEKLLLDCRELILCNSGNDSEDTELEDGKLLPLLDDYLAQMKPAKEKIARVEELMDEVDEDLRNQDTKTAHEKIVESQHILKSITGLCKPAAGKIRQRVVENEMKQGAINRELKKKRYEEQLAEDLQANKIEK